VFDGVEYKLYDIIYNLCIFYRITHTHTHIPLSLSLSFTHTHTHTHTHAHNHNHTHTHNCVRECSNNVSIIGTSFPAQVRALTPARVACRDGGSGCVRQGALLPTYGEPRGQSVAGFFDSIPSLEHCCEFAATATDRILVGRTGTWTRTSFESPLRWRLSRAGQRHRPRFEDSWATRLSPPAPRPAACASPGTAPSGPLRSPGPRRRLCRSEHFETISNRLASRAIAPARCRVRCGAASAEGEGASAVYARSSSFASGKGRARCLRLILPVRVDPGCLMRTNHHKKLAPPHSPVVPQRRSPRHRFRKSRRKTATAKAEECPASIEARLGGG